MRLPATPVDRRSVLRFGGLLGFGALTVACTTQHPGGAASSASVMPSAATAASANAPVSSSVLTAASSTIGSPSTPASRTAPDSASASASAVADFALDAATKVKLNSIFDAQFKGLGLVGMAAKVWVGAQEWSRSAGYADLAQKVPYRPGDHVRIASITKSFTASAVLRLVDAGQLQLTEVLGRYIPGVANGEKVTIANLLGMTSGIFDYTSDPEFLANFDADPTMAWSDADTLKIIKAHPANFAPGADLQYCDSNYALLGMILEKVSGEPVDKVISHQVISRFNLPSTSYPTGVTIPTPHPVGYVPGGTITNPNAPFDNDRNVPKVVTELTPAVPGAAGAMISSLDDLKVWGAEIAAGTLLKPATQAERLKARRFDGVPINIGYGLGCEVLNDFVGHNGAILGFSAVVMRDPKADVTLAAVANESTNSTTPTATWSYAVIKELFPAQWH